jgi:triphosphoribosyl-dephospho-CoA synthetase
MTPDGEAALTDLQSHCLAHRLSPGCCADILCVAIFLYLLLTSVEPASLKTIAALFVIPS